VPAGSLLSYAGGAPRNCHDPPDIFWQHLNHRQPFGVKAPIFAFMSTRVMTSSLDWWGLIPCLGLVWIVACLTQLARFAYAEINGRLPPRPFLLFAVECLSDGIVWMIAVIANEAHSRGLISFAALVVGMILTAAATYLIAKWTIS